MENKFYVYEWYNLDNNEVFYVGKGCNNRYKNIKDRNKEFIKYVKNNKVSVRIVKDKMTEKEAFEYEEYLSNLYKKQNQCSCNIAPCGKGGCHFIWTSTMKQNWSKNNPMKQESQRQRMRDNNPMKNKEIALKNGEKHKRKIIIDGIEYDSLKSASIYYNVSPTTIGNWCRAGKNPKGLQCSFMDTKQSSREATKVIIDDIEYPSISLASQAINVNPSTLAMALRKGQKFCKGHKCEYANQQPSQENSD